MKYTKDSQKQIMAMLRAGQEGIRGVLSAILSAQDHHKSFGDEIQGTGWEFENHTGSWRLQKNGDECG
jgi:hypothetical protein